MASLTSDTPDIISVTTVTSLSAVLALFGIAYGLSARYLPAQTSTKYRVLFIWHAWDALIHLTLEASFLYNCFFVSMPLASAVTSPVFSLPMTAPEVYFLNRPNHLHGAFYGDVVTARLWQEYAKADRRWGGSDLTVISLELLTVFVMAPSAVYACYCLTKRRFGPAWFWMTVVAVGELYGGFMTFAPEWLSGSPNLDTSNFMYLWVYLFFLNSLWVWFPLWILWEAYGIFTSAVTAHTAHATTKKSK